MKKTKSILTLLAIGCLSVLVLGACGNDSKKSDSKQSAEQSADLDYRSACEELDFGKAHEILDKLRDVYVNEGLRKASYQAYVDADIYIFREEVTYLMGLDDPNADKRILKLITETPLDGRKMDEGYCSFYDVIEEFGGSLVWLYSYCIKRNNQKCDIVMDLSIINGNKTLAKKVLSYYKDNMHIERGDEFDWDSNLTKTGIYNGKKVTFNGDNAYIWYDSADKDAAQKKYNEAVKNGMFE